MHFNAYGGNAALLAADLANLDDDGDARQIEQVLSAHLVSRFQLPGNTGLVQLRTWRRRLWAVFAAPTTAEKIDTVNGLLAEATARPFISTHDGQPPHLHFADEHTDVVTRVKATTAAGLAMVLAEAGPQRLGRCAAPGCHTVFVDVSRNGRRTYCSPTCATRVNVAAHRARSR
ncbi:MAG: CGNR zinc finger domain-containing protein [Pseudonocardia sp.]